MAAFAGPAASAAWILARAASLIPGAQTATVTYGDAVRPVTRPGHAPAHVTEFTAPDSTEDSVRPSTPSTAPSACPAPAPPACW